MRALRRPLSALTRWFWRRVDGFVPDRLRAGPADELRSARILVAVGLIVALTPPLGVAVGLAYDNLPLALMSAACHWVFALVPASLRAFGSLRVTTHVTAALGVAVATGWMLVSGGMDGAASALFVLGPMVAVIVLRRRDGFYWLVVVAAVLVALTAASSGGALDGWNLMGPQERTVGRLTMTFLAAVLVWGGMGAARRAQQITLAELDEANRRLAEARREAEAATLAKSRFLATMSHELRTPMNGVIGFADLLLQDEADEERRGALQTIQRSGQTLLALVNDVLDFSKMEAGAVELERVEFSLEAACVRALEMTAHRAHGAGVEVGFHLEADTDLIVRGDPVRLTQVLVNLLGNAAKFTEAGSVRLSVRRLDEGRFCFDVEDTGIGIAPKALEHLFTPFTQASADTTRRFGGTGLGLSISRALARAMGGDIRVRSEEGVGSTFSVDARLEVVGPAPTPDDTADLVGARVHIDGSDVLREDLTALAGRLALTVTSKPDAEALTIGPTPPVGGGAWLRVARVGWPEPPRRGPSIVMPTSLDSFAQAVRRARLATRGAPSPAFGAPGASPAGLRVLVVDDNPVNQRVAERMLVHLGHAAAVAANGAEALRRLEAREAFDLVLMDQQMPVMDGRTATERWRATETGPRLPILALTANPSLEEREACAAVGMDGFIDKPVTLRALAEGLAPYVAR